MSLPNAQDWSDCLKRARFLEDYQMVQRLLTEEYARLKNEMLSPEEFSVSISSNIDPNVLGELEKAKFIVKDSEIMENTLVIYLPMPYFDANDAIKKNNTPTPPQNLPRYSPAGKM